MAKRKKRHKLRNFIRLLALAAIVAAVVQELRKPEAERNWHGTLAGVVPYDFRKPSLEKIKSTLWDPDGSIVKERAFGVGWTLNVGGLVSKARAMSNGA